MKIRKNQIKNKCLSEKYYSSIKYMSHTLKGNERVEFIKTVCDINIYLGCLCATTCEANKEIDNYIWNVLNNYFKPQKVKYYDSYTKEWKVTEKRRRSFDITNYLLACNVMGNIKAIKWYLYNHLVQKTTIIQLAKDMNEQQLVELLFTLYKSDYNRDKIRGIGSTKNLYLMKNDYRVKLLLKGLWYKDRDAFIQLAYDTGWLSEIGKEARKKNHIYIECLKGVSKLMLALELIEDSIKLPYNKNNIFEHIIGLMNSSNDGKQFVYLVLLQKLQKGYRLEERDYKLLDSLPEPQEKIKNYFIPFFLDIVNGVFKDNIDYLKIVTYFSKVYIRPNIYVTQKGRAKNNNLKLIIKEYEDIDIKKILHFYMKTTMGTKASFEELLRLLNYYHDIQLKDLLDELKKYQFWITRIKKEAYVFKEIRTENYVEIQGKKYDNQNILVEIEDYDYINRIFYVKPYEGEIIYK